MAEATFRATVVASGRGGGHLVEVPPDAVTRLGGKGRLPVRVTFDGIAYRGSIVTMGGVKMLGVTKAILAEAGKAQGDTLTVVVRNDEEPRVVEVPDELAKAFRSSKVAREFFGSLSYSHQREYVGYITEAKKPETRARRVARTIDMLVEQDSTKER
jgi:hypothetical protein